MIVGLVLLLLIPTFYVQNLVSEREQRQKEAINEVSSKCALRQTITSPLVVVPYELLKFPEQNIFWNEAFVRIDISDLKGLNDELKLKWKDSTIDLSPNSFADSYKLEGLAASLPIHSITDLRNTHFDAGVNLSGSEQLLFNAVGKSTTVQVSSKWQHPSFTGSILPQSTVIKDSGFSAIWKSLAHTRSLPQQFKDENATYNSLKNAANAFCVDLFIPVNTYQKTMRSVKYVVLCILLTFAVFYLIETVNKHSVHPMQYGLIGLALILFYTLLLSF